MLKDRYPRDFILDTYSTDEKMTTLSHKAAEDALKKSGETPENILYYQYLILIFNRYVDKGGR